MTVRDGDAVVVGESDAVDVEDLVGVSEAEVVRDLVGLGDGVILALGVGEGLTDSEGELVSETVPELEEVRE